MGRTQVGGQQGLAGLVTAVRSGRGDDPGQVVFRSLLILKASEQGWKDLMMSLGWLTASLKYGPW